MDLPKLNFPDYPFTLKRKSGQLYITCAIRKREILLTPEEWVRQNVIQFLITEKGYSKNLIAVEKQLIVNNMKKRYDLLVFSKDGVPIILGEFKAPDVNITESTIKQIVNYNKSLMVSYLLLSNGMTHYFSFVNIEKGEINFFDSIPKFSNLAY